MKKFLLVLLLLACSTAHAETETSSNLITNTWNNVTTGTHPNNCCTGGPGPLYDPATNTIHFSYGLTAVHQVQAINQALSGSGVQINGWNWAYDIRNLNGVAGNQNGTDSIAVTSFITNSSGQIVQQSDQNYNTQFDWTRFSGTETLNSAIQLDNNVNLGIQFVARDGGYWAGYYGPQVRDVTLTANYTVDQCSVDPQSSPSCPGFRTYYQMSDDGYAQVNLPFAFPFYGNNYTTSYMFTNGVIGFLNPNNSFCCDGTDLNNQASQANSPWNYAIYALNTDLYPGNNSTFYTQQTDGGTGLTYTWDKVIEIGTNLENTFSVNIKDTGYIGITYDQVNLNSNRNPLIGIAGDISKGEYSQYWFGPVSNMPNLAGTTITFTGTETTDVCAINPLYSSTCPDYAQAYYDQQCSYNALYDSGCSGYEEAYFSQQCNADQLYDAACPGYAQAYLDYQCNADPLYSTQCSGYAQAYYEQQCTADPFYDSGCSGYQAAVTQCDADPLSNTYCPTYQTAVSECSANGLTHDYCPSYKLETELCSLDPLSNNLCTGYDTAKKECSTNQLLYPYCTDYTTTLAACATDPQSNTLCPGYSTVTASNPTESKTVAEVTISDTGTVATAPSATGDATVDKVINTSTTTAAPATSATAAVKLAPVAPAPTETVAVAAKPAAKEEKKAEAKTETKTETKTEVAGTSTGEKKETKKQSLRQQIAAKRKEAAMNSAVAAGEKASEDLDKATSLAAQVAVQNIVMAAMGFTPGFQSYSVIMPDGMGYKPFVVYPNQRNVDNARTLRRMSGASDRLHTQMVDQQWELAQ